LEQVFSADSPTTPGTAEGQVVKGTRFKSVQFVGSNDVMAMLNVAGVHLDFAGMFSSPALWLTGTPGSRCGLRLWTDDTMICGFEAVTGGGISDPVRSFFPPVGGAPPQVPTPVYLGTGVISHPFTAASAIEMTGAVSAFDNPFNPCPNPGPTSTFDTQEL